MSFELQFVDSVPSTMDAARENVLAGRVRFDANGHADPAGVVAREQTAGRGQRGRQWFAKPGECLCATYYLRFASLTPATAWSLAFVVGGAVAEVVQRVCENANVITANTNSITVGPIVSKVPRVGLKWPNDLLLNGKKVGGILIELAQPSPDNWVALIGVGININIRDFPPELELSATSLVRESVDGIDGDHHGDCQALAYQVAKTLNIYKALYCNDGVEAILTRWRQLDETVGRFYETTLDGEIVKGRAEGVEADGALRLRLADGRILKVHSASSIKEIPK